jgi:hypothetical protein
MLNMARNSFDVGLRTMETMSKQTEKAYNMAMNNADLIHGETKEMVGGWVDNYRKMHQSYAGAVKNGLENLEQTFVPKSAPSAKSK